MIIDGKDLIMGRLGTLVAKKLLLGEDVVVLNSKDVIITGNKDELIKRYQGFRSRGVHAKGPFYSRRPDLFLKRALRGMLPHKSPRGREALKRLKCHTSVPEEFEGKDAETIKTANVSKVPNQKYMRIQDICKILGGRS